MPFLSLSASRPAALLIALSLIAAFALPASAQTQEAPASGGQAPQAAADLQVFKDWFLRCGNTPQGDERCVLALEVLATAARDYLGAYVVEMGGLDAVSFTGGIGEHSSIVRGLILRDLEFLGVQMDAEKNEQVHGEGTLHAEGSRVHIHVMVTDEELVVARQTYEFLQE